LELLLLLDAAGAEALSFDEEEAPSDFELLLSEELGDLLESGEDELLSPDLASEPLESEPEPESELESEPEDFFWPLLA
jgi:hypothetical protein